MSNKDKKKKISDLQDKFSDLQNKYLRLLAETENTRNRMQKEKQESLTFAIENTITEFLPLIDNFENALNFASNSSEEVKNWAIGFDMILSQIKDILNDHDIVSYNSLGNKFDPHLHEVVEIIESDEHEPGSVIEEFAKGYKSSNRTIRPARVKVTKQTQEKNETKDEKPVPVLEKESNDKEKKDSTDDSENTQIEETANENINDEGENIKVNK